MFDHNTMLTTAAFIKWQRGEPMSKEDLERIIGVLENSPLSISNVSPEDTAAIQVRLRQVLHNKFGMPKS